MNEDLCFALRDIRALVDTARLSVLYINASETESAAEVLLIAVNRLTDLLEPEEQQGGADHE